MQPSRRTLRGPALRASSRSTSSRTRTAPTPTAPRSRPAPTSRPLASCRPTRAMPSRYRKPCPLGMCAYSLRGSPRARSTTTSRAQRTCASRGARSSPLRTTAGRDAWAGLRTLSWQTSASSTPSPSSASRLKLTTASLMPSSMRAILLASLYSFNQRPQRSNPQRNVFAVRRRLRLRRRHGRRRLHAPAAARDRADALHGDPGERVTQTLAGPSEPSDPNLTSPQFPSCRPRVCLQLHSLENAVRVGGRERWSQLGEWHADVLQFR